MPKMNECERLFRKASTEVERVQTDSFLSVLILPLPLHSFLTPNALDHAVANGFGGIGRIYDERAAATKSERRAGWILWIARDFAPLGDHDDHVGLDVSVRGNPVSGSYGMDLE